MSILNVQHHLGADGSSATGGTVALTGSAVTSGSLVVGAVQWGSGTPTLTSVTDDKGNTYNIADNVQEATDTQSQATFWLNNITNAPSTITATFNNANTQFRRILWDEFSGIDTGATPTDGHTEQAPAAGTGTDAQTSGNITTTVNGDLIWAAFSDTQGAGATWSAGTGFTILNNGTNADNDNMGSEWQVQSTAGSIAGTFTENVSSRSVVGAIAFKAAGGGGATPIVVGQTPRRIFVPGKGPDQGMRSPKAFPASAGSIFNDSVTEAATATDAETVTAVFAVSDSETGIAIDTPSVTAVFAASDTEAATATDTLTAGTSTPASITEAATATETETTTAVFAASDTEAATATETDVATAVFAAAQTEVAAAADTDSVAASFVASINESGAASDTTNAALGSQTYNVSQTEAATATDVAAATVTSAVSDAGNYGGRRRHTDWEGARTKRERLEDAKRERELAEQKVAFKKKLEASIRPPAVEKPPERQAAVKPKPVSRVEHDTSELEIAELQVTAAKARVVAAEISAKGNATETRQKAEAARVKAVRVEAARVAAIEDKRRAQRAYDDALAMVLLSL